MNSSLIDSSMDMKSKDRWNAIVANHTLQPIESGILSGYKFAVKDVFHIKGYCNSAGNPDWLKTHEVANKDALAIQLLLKNGAEMVATTHTDELMFSLNGENVHYGTPVNPASPERIPGGSSSGSASIVAAGEVDFSLGTDTGGSVRVPASYCGIYGFRPTHEAVLLEGVIPLAPSFDTVGWFSQDLSIVDKVAQVLLQHNIADDANVDFDTAFFSKEAWELVSPDAHDQMLTFAKSLTESMKETAWTNITENGLVDWMSAFRMLQGKEIWESHGEWITKENPSFGPGISERFAWTSTLTEDEVKPYAQFRQHVRSQLHELLGTHGLLVIPTTPDVAPLLQQSGEELEERRKQTLQLTSIAGLSGLPQLTIPIGLLNGSPVSISVIAGHGQDQRLIRFVTKLLTNK